VFPISDRSNLKQRVSTAIGAPLNKLGRIPVVELLATPLPLDEDDEDEDDDVHGGDHYAKRQKVLLANASASASSAGGAMVAGKRPTLGEDRQTTKQRNKAERKAEHQRHADAKMARRALVEQIERYELHTFSGTAKRSTRHSSHSHSSCSRSFISAF
jgi:hypothetical protein